MSQSPSPRMEVLRNRYKAAVDADEARRRREDNLVEIRKRREESLLKKRHEGLQAQQFPSPADVHAPNMQEKILSADKVMDAFEKTLVETHAKLRELEDKFGSGHILADTATEAFAANVSTATESLLEAQANAATISEAVSSYQALSGELATLRNVVKKLQTDFQGLKDLSKTRLTASPAVLDESKKDFPKIFVSGEGSSRQKFIPSPRAAKLKFVDKVNEVSPSLSPKSGSSETPKSPSTFETKEQFLAWYNEQMKIVFETRPSDICFPDHKGMYPRFNFLPGAEPALVKQIFDIGALNQVYFTNTLEEISLFPEVVKKALSNYARFAPGARDPGAVMFLKVYSAAPTYDEELEGRIPALHILQVGVYRGKNHVIDTNQTYKEYRYHHMDNIGLKRGRDLRVLFQTLGNILTKKGQRMLVSSEHHMVLTMASKFPPGQREKIELLQDQIFGNKIKTCRYSKKWICKELKHQPNTCAICSTAGRPVAPREIDQITPPETREHAEESKFMAWLDQVTEAIMWPGDFM